MNLATRIWIHTLLRCAKGMIVATEKWLDTQHVVHGSAVQPADRPPALLANPPTPD